MAAADWTAIENALAALVKRASGYPVVIWADQNAERPAKPYCSLRLDNDGSAAGLDELRVRDADAPAPGADLVLETVKHDEFLFTVNVYGAAVTGPLSARVVATKVKNALSLESNIEALDAANIAVIDQGTVQNLTALLEVEFEPRAVLAIRLRVADGAEELNTWIETVETTTEIIK